MAEINKQIVARYYIESELDNIVAGDNVRITEGLSDDDTLRLLEALSFTYRLNSVYDYIESHRVRWEERRVDVRDIALTGMGIRLTELIYSEEIGQNPHRFAEYIQNHSEDPRFAELKARDVPENRRKVLLRQDGDLLKMLDGSHRFLSMVMQGEETVDAYVAMLAAPEDKPAIGDATFLRLRRLWQQTDDPAFREAIEQTTAGMIRETSNGSQSVQEYWVTLGQNETIRAVGERLIKENSSREEGRHSGFFRESDL